MVASTLLFTDGLANHGVTSTDAIVKSMGAVEDFTVHTFGFGTDHDANMLKCVFHSLQLGGYESRSWGLLSFAPVALDTVV